MIYERIVILGYCTSSTYFSHRFFFLFVFTGKSWCISIQRILISKIGIVKPARSRQFIDTGHEKYSISLIVHFVCFVRITDNEKET